VSSVVQKWAVLVALRDRRIKAGWSCPLLDQASWTAPPKKKKKQTEDVEDGDDAAVNASSSGSSSSDDSDPSSSDDDSSTADDVIGDDEVVRTINGIPVRELGGGKTKWSALGNNRCTGHDGPHPVTTNKRAPAQKRRTSLLSDPLGVTPLNHVMDSALCGIFKTHVILVKRLETRLQPIGHMTARWVRTYVPTSPFETVTRL
jgi:hypothetical protein